MITTSLYFLECIGASDGVKYFNKMHSISTTVDSQQ